jgi:hypothetical protein
MAEGDQEPGDTSVVGRERAVDIAGAIVALVCDEAELSWTTSGNHKALSVHEDCGHCSLKIGELRQEHL